LEAHLPTRLFRHAQGLEGRLSQRLLRLSAILYDDFAGGMRVVSVLSLGLDLLPFLVQKLLFEPNCLIQLASVPEILVPSHDDIALYLRSLPIDFPRVVLAHNLLPV